jgi:drug/metabolite transporter (DMT)-like permease
MLELGLTILFSSLIIVTFRLIEKFKVDELEAIVWNYFFATLLGVLVWRESLTLETFTEKSWFGLALLIGVFFIITFFLLSRSSVKAGLAITAVSSRMSVVIPVIAGFVLFGDDLSFLKIIGISFALFSFFLIFKPGGKMDFNLKKAALPFLLFLGIGANDTLMKYIEHHYLAGDESLFLTVVFFVALCIGMLLVLPKIIFNKKRLSLKGMFGGLILGSLNFGTTYFFIRSMKHFDTTVLFPVVNVSIVALTTFLGVLFFHEKLSKVNWAGIFMAILAILLISTA